MLTPERVREIRERAENYQGSADKVILYAQIEDLRRTVLALCGAVEEAWRGRDCLHRFVRSLHRDAAPGTHSERNLSFVLTKIETELGAPDLAPGAEREGRE